MSFMGSMAHVTVKLTCNGKTKGNIWVVEQRTKLAVVSFWLNLCF